MTELKVRKTARFGSGRLVFWRGGILWIGRGEGEAGFHAHHAIQISLSLSEGTIWLQDPGTDWSAYNAAITPSNHPHAFDARGERIALIFIEPESRDGRALRERFHSGIASLTAEALTGEINSLRGAHDRQAGDDELAGLARAVAVKLTAPQTILPKPIDKRIGSAIDLLRARIAAPVAMSEVADAVHLSSERFRHLFLQETGIRFRPFVLWLRIELALASYAAGNSLTDAAHAGGFADSAHFSRTFKRMFGVAPVEVRRL